MNKIQEVEVVEANATDMNVWVEANCLKVFICWYTRDIC